MDRPLDILMLEDVDADALLAEHELRQAGIACRVRRVATEQAYREALEGARPDVILSDFALPDFDGFRALDIAGRAAPRTPFIFVSGHIGEERAIEALKQGATDYVLKGNLKRLAPAVRRATEEATRRAALEERLTWLATHDGLTGLPNRNLLEDRLEQAIVHARRAGRAVGVVFVDLDRFKLVNDSLGHDAGDVLLEAVARQLAEAVRPGDTVARPSGDEFVIVVGDLAREEHVALVADKLRARVSRPFEVAGRELHVSVSLGVALYPKDGETAQTLLRNADTALFRAKDSSRGQCCFYSHDMNARVSGRLDLENKLRRAVDEERFVLHYQPKRALAGGGLSGLEAALRWQDPEAGLVAPGEFIPVLEETGMIVEVGRWALRRAAADHARWRGLGLAPPPVAVNVSAVQLHQPDFVDSVMEVVQGAARGGIGLEITESLLIEDFEGTVDKLAALRGKGLEIAIDDFGTGHSSLAYLARLPVTALKIDRSFVAALAPESTAMAIVAAIVSLAHALGLKVVAEGVEREEQAGLLRRLGCDEAQGFLYGAPVSEEHIGAMLGGR